MRLFYTLLLVAVTAVWGWTFVVVQNAIVIYGVLPFLAMRFVLAGAVLTPLYATRLTRRSLLVGGAIGVVLAAAYLFQTLGLLFTYHLALARGTNPDTFRVDDPRFARADVSARL